MTASITYLLTIIAVKCNPDKEVLRLLALLGTGFDCASRGEIEQILDSGVEPSRIIYANPCKAKSNLRYAQRVGIRRMTFDDTDELYKIKAICPEAELLLRIVADDSSSVCRFSTKFGARLDCVRKLLRVASELELKVIGVSFHIGSAATNPQSFVQAVRDARIVFDWAQELGYSPKVLDVGGGFSTESFETMSQPLALALDKWFPGDFEIIAEPGRYYVASAFTLACNVIGRRVIRATGKSSLYSLYLNDGVYHNFLECLICHWDPKPRILLSSNEQVTTAAIQYSIWGHTCDSFDQIIKDLSFHKILDIGDWLYFDGMGAYTLCLSTSFNGFPNKPKVDYISSEPTARALLCY